METARIVGRAGTVEFLPLDRPEGDYLPESTATLVQALLSAQPSQHPLWNQYVLFVAHLRHIRGQTKPPVRPHAEDTHNLMAMALNPEYGRVIAADYQIWQRRPGWYLMPLNFSIFHRALTDAQAVQVFSLVCRAFAEGLFIVEPQGIRGAAEFVRQSIEETCQHVREGRHAPA